VPHVRSRAQASSAGRAKRSNRAARDMRRACSWGSATAQGLAGVTFKALSNGQLAQLPRAYVDACCAMHELGDHACQLAAVVTR
jgi:hypothetical protein